MAMSEELQSFIARYIHSIEQLEIVCALNENAQASMSVDEIYLKIKSNKDSIAACLDNFQKEGLVERAEGSRFQLSPKLPDLNRRISELWAAYRDRRVTLIETIYGRPRSDVHYFAEAFKLRKDK